MVSAVVVVRVALVGLFALAGVTKLLDRSGTLRSVIGFGVPARLAPVVARALPAAELTTAVLLSGSETAWIGGVAALVLLVLFCIAAAVNLARGRAPECACFGQVHSEPVGARLLVRNMAFALLAIAVVVNGSPDAGPSLWAWARKLSVGEAGMLLAIAGLAVTVLVLSRRVRSMRTAMDALVAATDRSEASPDEQALVEPASAEPSAAPAFPLGLPIGTAAPDFSLPSADGSVALADLLSADRPLVLLFVAPTCRTCHPLLPKPPVWAVTYGDVLTFALVTAGTAAANEGIDEHIGGFRPVLFDPGSARQAYEAAATPAGVVVGRHGTIESETVYGVADIAMLVMRTAAAERARVQPATSRR